MKRQGILGAAVLMVCLVIASVWFLPGDVSAKQGASEDKIKSLATKKVKGARIVSVERSKENGEAVYEVELTKGKKEYDLVYRISDYKLLSYEWKTKSRYVKNSKGKMISKNKAKRLAKKRVKGAKITAVYKKRSSGIVVYKVKMKTGDKKFKLELHAHSGKTLEYEWEIIVRKKANNRSNQHNQDSQTDKISYIGMEAAKKAAVADAGAAYEEAVFTEVKLEREHEVMVYEIEFYTKEYKYEYEIDAITGKVIEKKRKKLNAVVDNSGNNGNAGNTATYIGIERAKQIALNHVGSGVVVKAEFDREDGQPVYEVEILSGVWEYDIEIHAVSGTILKVEMEDKDD